MLSVPFRLLPSDHYSIQFSGSLQLVTKCFQCHVIYCPSSERNVNLSQNVNSIQPREFVTQLSPIIIDPLSQATPTPQTSTVAIGIAYTYLCRHILSSHSYTDSNLHRNLGPSKLEAPAPALPSTSTSRTQDIRTTAAGLTEPHHTCAKQTTPTFLPTSHRHSSNADVHPAQEGKTPPAAVDDTGRAQPYKANSTYTYMHTCCCDRGR